MTIKIEDFAFGNQPKNPSGNQQPKNPNEKPNHQLSPLSEEELQGLVGCNNGSETFYPFDYRFSGRF